MSGAVVGDAPLPLPQVPPAAQNLSDNINVTLASAPELTNDPGSAVAIASGGGNVTLKAQAVSHAVNQAGVVAAAQHVNTGGGGFFGDIVHGLGDVVGAIGSVLNKPLSIVQHEYRYLHDVEARHGLGVAVLEGAGLAVGATVGGVLGTIAGGNTVEGATLGAEGAGYLEGKVAYKDSWARTANGATYRDPHTGQLVSFGRDVASALGTSGGTKTVLSGVLDGIADLTADPASVAGKVYGAQKTLSLTAEHIDQAWNNPLTGFRRAAQDIAASDAATIARHYPQFANVSAELGALHTGEDVRDWLRSVVSAHELLDATKLPTVDSVTPELNAANLPSLSPLHVPFRDLRDAARDAGKGTSFFSRHIMNNAILGPGRWADRLEAQPGNAFDRASMDISGTQYNPANNDGLLNVMNMVRYSGTETTARAVANAIAYATPAQRIVIFRNAFMKTLFHMARIEFPEDAELELTNPAMEKSMLELVDGQTKKAILERLENHISAAQIEGGKPEQMYGSTWRGTNIKPVLDEEGNRLQGAITPNQTGNLSIPNLVETRRMAAAIRQARTSIFLGGVDDALYEHVTQGFFKPLVLQSGGYGLHIALAEMIPNTLRHGLGPSIKAVYNRALADLGIKAADDNLGIITAWLYRMGGAKALENSEDARYLLQSYELMEGYKRPVGMAAGEVTYGETQPVERALGGFQQGMAMSTREGSNFHPLAGGDPRFLDAWHAELRENVNKWTTPGAQVYKDMLDSGHTVSEATEAARQAVAQILRNDPEHTDNYVRALGKLDGAPPAWDAADGHAMAIVDKLKGAIHARPTQFDDFGNATVEGKVNEDLLASLANGRIPTREELSDIDVGDRPLTVKGRELLPSGVSTVQRIANFGFRKILNPMVNILSRNQEFALEYVRLRREMQPLVDQGLKSEDEVATDAMARATTHSMRFVHNLHDRTQWTATMRNWAPFYFAQEQAYRRMGRLLVEDPGAFRRYQLMISGVHNLAVNMQDAQGNKYIAFPGSGFLGTGVADLMGESGLTVGSVAPASLGGSFSSANVIFPFSQGVKPDLGPLVLIPAAQLSTMFTELNSNYADHNPVLSVAANDLSSVAGSLTMSQSFWEQLIPNATAQRILQTVTGNDRAFNSSVMQAYQFAAYQQAQATTQWIKGGRKGPEPEIIPPANATALQKEQFQNKIRNYVRMLYFVRAVTGFMSPVSSNVEIQNLNIPARLQQYITRYGSVSLGMQAAHLDHPEWDPWMVSESYVPSAIDASQSSGYSLPSSQPAMQWIDQNSALLRKYGVAALWLMPQLTNSVYSPTIYNQQIAEGLRIKETPDQFLKALYVNAGNNLYYDALTVHENALTAAGNSSIAKNQEYDAWNSYLLQLQRQNPVWAEDFLSANKQLNRQNAIQQLTAMYNSGDAPAGPQTDAVGFLLNQYYQAAANYQAAGNLTDYSLQLSEQKRVNDSWIQYVTTLETEQPALKPIINGVFKEALVNKT